MAKRTALAATAKTIKRPVEDEAEWSPTVRDIDAYHEWARGIQVEEIANRLELSRTQTFARLQQTSAWIRQERLDDIAELRTQHVMLLMRQYRQLEQLWDAARIAIPGKGRSRGTKPAPEGGTKVGDVVRLDRPIQIVKEMRQTLEAIGVLLGVRTARADGGDAGDDERVAGMTRSGVLLREILKLQVQMEREVQLEQGIGGGNNDVRHVPTAAG